MQEYIAQSLQVGIDLKAAVLADRQMTADLERVGRLMAEAVTDGRKVLLCGNGGSAADAQHIAAELVGRFMTNRRGLPSIALTTDTSILTAVSNDYGYDHVFERQVEALGGKGDLLIGISTSGNSPNVERALVKRTPDGNRHHRTAGTRRRTLPRPVRLCLCGAPHRVGTHPW